MADQEKTMTKIQTHYHEWSPNKVDGISKNSQEIEEDINKTRDEMDATIDRLSNRFHPFNLIDRVFDFLQMRNNREEARKFAQDTGRKIGESLRDNPMPAILIGAGIGWVYWNVQYGSDRPSTHAGPGAMDKARSTFSTARDTVSGAAESIKEKAESMFGEAKERMGQARENVEQWKQEADQQREGYRSSMEETGERMRSEYRRGRENIGNMVQDHPLALGIAALAAGLLAGIAFPSSRPENRMMGRTADRVKEKAGDIAQDTAEKAKDAVDDTMDTMRRQASPEGSAPNPEAPYTPPEPDDEDISGKSKRNEP